MNPELERADYKFLTIQGSSRTPLEQTESAEREGKGKRRAHWALKFWLVSKSSAGDQLEEPGTRRFLSRF